MSPPASEKPIIVRDGHRIVRVSEIVARIRDGEPVNDIAASIGYHPAALYRRLHQLGYSGGRKRR